MNTTTLSALFHAIEHNELEHVQAIIVSQPDLVNHENEQGLTPLGYAAHFGHPDVVQALLDAGAEVNAVSHSKLSFIPSNTALHAAIAGTRSEAVISMLLQHGASVNLFDSNGHTVLHVAAFHDDNTKLIQQLLERGADVNAAIEGGEKPLAVALRQGNQQVAALLQQQGAR
ncbi:ankyrin repeat protein [Paenibacillus phyllosphaerae]|uniref:Ankyrin repeat protein n=1 Tax=Paenibacillus phyllosphaerae TaxID=274593 RepID=A0A7W5FL07_9BACL|nr:ankyrin repeat domain-containing protein [Paenibacillus phyllosphaerae]MBB3108715.1 ankyrin repeat protein [Paenibacillus phyllosphaerae]